MNKSGFFWGLLLIIVGGILLVSNFTDWQIIRMERLWPVFILIPGLAFEFSYFSNRRNPGVLVPGGILTTLGLLFFFETFTNWYFAPYTWPIYPLAVAIGLFQLYLFAGRQRPLLIPVAILTAVSAISFSTMFINSIQRWVDFGLVIPILLVLAGLVIVFRSK